MRPATPGAAATTATPANLAPVASHPQRKTPPTMTRTRRRALATTAALGTVVALAVQAPAAAAPADTATATPMLAPYYTELDLTGDGAVDEADLDVAAEALGATSGDAGWDGVAVIDQDGDGTITVGDLAGLSQRVIYDDGPFELVEAGVVDMQAAMNAGVTTSVEITQDYIDRIAAYDTEIVDTSAGGRALNSIITVGEDSALAAAAAADTERETSGMTSMLLGVPVAVKDNYDTEDMVTTGGCGCWDDNQTDSDAAMVAGLRDAGAVILAKASLDEFAYGFASEFSAGQPAGSSTLVASPYVTSRTAGGSSGGTGAAIAANLAGVGFGTDTGGSIRIPSSYNQLVGIRPTVGLTSRDGIIPLALSQDTGGPMARSVTDAAVSLDAVIGVDAADAATAAQQGKTPESYTAALDEDALDGARIGYFPSMVGSNATTTRLFAEAKTALEAQGATVVELTEPEGFSAVMAEPSGSTNEFTHDLNEYIDTHLAPGVAARSLSDIIASGRVVPSRVPTYQTRNAVTEETYQAWAGENGTHTRQLAAGKTLLTQVLEDNDLDTIVYPSGTPYGTQGLNMRLSPNTGLPAVTVPMGQASAADATVTGAGVNLEFLGRAFDESTLIGLGYSFEQATQARTTPALYGPLG